MPNIVGKQSDCILCLVNNILNTTNILYKDVGSQITVILDEYYSLTQLEEVDVIVTAPDILQKQGKSSAIVCL